MFRLMFSIIMSLLHACNQSGGGESSRVIQTNTNSSIQVYSDQAAFPICSEATKDSIVYSWIDASMFVCDGLRYSKTGGTLSPEDEAKSNTLAAACAQAVEVIPDPIGLTGQLAFDLGSDVDPCQVSGYIVGQQSNQKIEVTKLGTYFVNNVPPGEHDIVVTAGSLQIGSTLVGSKPDVGLRLNGVNSITGVSNQLGKIKLQRFGSLSGTALLDAGSGVIDYAGILVYIPGTEYSAYTAEDGKFSITEIPPGIHKLYFEKNGFERGQVGAVQVDSETNTQVAPVSLGLSTNVSGSFLVTNSFKTTGGQTVVPGIKADMLMLPSSSSVLMMFKDSISEGLWSPIRTNYSYALDIDKFVLERQWGWGQPQTYITSPINNSLLAKYADANGLESDVISKNFFFDLFGTASDYFRPSFSATLSRLPWQINLTNIVNPAKAERLAVLHAPPNSSEQQGLDSSGSQNLQFRALANQVTIPLAQSIANCGPHQVNLIYEGYQGRVRSSAYNNFNNMGSFAKTVYNKCYTDTTDSGAPTVRRSTNSYNQYYSAVWTGSKVIVFGFDQNGTFTGGAYDPAANAWTALDVTGTYAPKATIKYGFEMQYLRGRIFLYGGASSGGSLVNALHIFDVASNSWIDTAPDPLSSGIGPTALDWRYLSYATDGRYAAFFNSQGTYNSGSNHYEMSFQTYDPDVAVGSNPWSSPIIVSGQVPIQDFMSVPVSSQALIVGGKDNMNSPVTSSFMLNLANGQQSLQSNFPANTSMIKPWFSSFFVSEVDADLANRINFFSANNNNPVALNYTISTQTWTKDNIGSEWFYADSKPIIYNNQFIYTNGISASFINLSTGALLSGQFGENAYNATPPNLWATNTPNVVLPIPSLRKIFIWGGTRSYWIGMSQQYEDTQKGILLDLVYPDNWLP